MTNGHELYAVVGTNGRLDVVSKELADKIAAARPRVAMRIYRIDEPNKTLYLETAR